MVVTPRIVAQSLTPVLDDYFGTSIVLVNEKLKMSPKSTLTLNEFCNNIKNHTFFYTLHLPIRMFNLVIVGMYNSKIHKYRCLHFRVKPRTSY